MAFIYVSAVIVSDLFLDSWYIAYFLCTFGYSGDVIFSKTLSSNGKTAYAMHTHLPLSSNGGVNATNFTSLMEKQSSPTGLLIVAYLLDIRLEH